MDFDKKYSCLERNNLVCKKIVEIENDFQQTLQQFSNDIYRVVKCNCHGYLTSVDVADDDVIINGKIQLFLTYYNDESVLSYADFEEDFTKTVTIEGLSQSAFATGRIYDKYTNFRVVNQRKIDIHCAHCISLLVFDKISNPCLASCNNSRLRYESMKYTNIINVSQNKVEFDEEYPITVNGEIKRIISSSAYTNVIETKLIKDKALIKTRVNFVVNYTSGEDEEIIETAQFKVELSKILEIAGVDEGDILIPSVNCGSVYAKVKNGNDPSKSVIELYGDISIMSTVLREQEANIVTDGYIINHASSCNYDKCTIACDGRMICNSDTCNTSFNFNNDIYEVKNLDVSVMDYQVRDGKMLIRLNAVLLCVNLEGSVVSYFAQSQASVVIGDYTDAIAGIAIDGFDYTLSSANTIEARVVINVTSYAYNSRCINLLTEIDASEEATDFPALTVYFAKQNESIWNIAKSFSSDISLIQKENNLSCEVLDSNKVLLIPGV